MAPSPLPPARSSLDNAALPRIALDAALSSRPWRHHALPFALAAATQPPPSSRLRGRFRRPSSRRRRRHRLGARGDTSAAATDGPPTDACIVHETTTTPALHRPQQEERSEAKVADVPQIIPLVKATVADEMIDPHLCLIDDCRLAITSAQSSNSEMVYGSEEDESDAQVFLSAVSKDDTQLKEIVMSYFKEKFENLPEKFNGIEEQLLQEFSLDDSFSLGAPLFMETPHSCSMYAEKDSHCFDEEVIPSEMDDDDDIVFEHSGYQSDKRTSGSMASSDVLNVNQLIESVHETARRVAANLPVSANPVPYDQMKSQCEALVMEKQQKMSVLLSFKHSRTDSRSSTGESGLETNESSARSEPELQWTRKECMHRSDSASSESDRSFRLPPASPYDKFLKAAGR